MSAVRSVLALLVLLALVVALVAAAEWFVRGQVEAVVADVVDQQLDAASDGEGFATVDTQVDGWALVGLVTGRLDAVHVQATDGVVSGIPVETLELTATGVEDGGRQLDGLTGTVRADGAQAVAVGLDPAVADAVVDSAEAVPPDRIRLTAPFEIPLLGEIPVEAVVELREVDGGLEVQPVSASAGGLGVDLESNPVLPRYGIDAADLPADLRVTEVEVVDDGGRPVVVVDLACPAGCSLRG